MFAHFKDYHGNHKNFKSLYGFGGRCLKIRDVCMDFEVIYQKRVRVFHQVFQTPRNRSFEVFGTRDETRSTSFWYSFLNELPTII